MDFWVFLIPIPTKPAVISWKLPTGDTDELVLSVENHFMQRSRSKNQQKLPENVKKLANFQFFQ